MLKISFNQMNPTIGDFAINQAEIIAYFEKSAQEKSDIVVFPELALSGYYPMDMLNDPIFLRKNDDALTAIAEASKSYPALTVILGTVRQNGGIGKNLHNSLVVINNGNIVAEYHKQLLPTYNIFDERRHFEPGEAKPCIISVAGETIGLIICEDGWNDDEQDYAANPYRQLADAGIKTVISLNASPSNLGKREQRHNLMAKACQKYGISLLYVNCVGGQDSLVFDGATFAMNAKGELTYEAPMFETAFDSVVLNNGEIKAAQSNYTMPAPLPKYEFYFQQIVMGLRDYTRRCGFKKVVVGSSGGIDSALTLALAAEALGKENVIAITMPSVYSSSGSVTDSEALCKNLGIELLTYPIRTIAKDFKDQFHESFTMECAGLTEENLQARIRGTILMAYSNKSGALVLTTGNKSEISVGYCTLYGDTNGGLGLIGDLYKTEVFALSRYINERADREIIPVSIIDKEPSAELADGQKDSDSLPPYEALDPLLKLLIEGKQLSDDEYKESVELVNDYYGDDVGQGEYERVKRMIARNEYKRRQAPPIIRVRGRAFGNGRQMPLAAVYN